MRSIRVYGPACVLPPLVLGPMMLLVACIGGPQAARAQSQLLAPTGRAVSHVLFSPDGETLASATEEHVVLWDVARRERRATLDVRVPEADLVDPRLSLTRMVFSHDGRFLAVAAAQGLQLWDVHSGTRVHALGKSIFVRALAFSPNGEALAEAGRGVRLWSISEKRPVARTLIDEGACTVDFVHFSPDSTRLVVAGAAGAIPQSFIRSIDLSGGAVTDFYIASQALVMSGESSVKGDSFLIGSWEHIVDKWLVKLWRADGKRDDEPRLTLSGAGKLRAVKLSPDGRFIATTKRGVAGDVVQLWDARTGDAHSTIRRRNAWCDGVEFTRDGTRLLIAEQEVGPPGPTSGYRDRVILWDSEGRRALGELYAGSKRDATTFSDTHSSIPIDVSPDGSLVAIGCQDGSLMLCPIPAKGSR